MKNPLMTEQVESRRPISRRCRDACLVHIYPTGIAMGTRHLLNREHAVLGRGDECDITIHDNSISRRHMRFELVDGDYHARDMGSTNGTFVNDTPVDGTRLRDGDYLRVGNCLFRFLEGGNIEADYHEELYRMAILDALTGLHNKRDLLDYLEREVARSSRYGRPLALILFDIDHFKAINDTFGHLAGDMTLRDLAGCLKTTIRLDEMMARYGGEEFAVVLPETSQGEASDAAERLRLTAAGHAFAFEGSPIQVTISLGVASMQGHEELTPQELIRRADERLYRAKQDGRNRVAS